MTNPQASTTLLHPADVFTHLIITYLTPMFLATTGGDLQYARLAAAEAVNAYAAREPIDLLSIAQIIAFSLAILDSLDRSMADTLPVSLVLRLRGNAVSLGRVAERCRRALRAPPSNDTALCHPSPDFDPEAERQREAAVIADIARAEQRLTASKTNRTAEAPVAPEPARPDHEASAYAAAQQNIAGLNDALSATDRPAAQQAAHGPTSIPRPPATQDEGRRTLWAAAMTAVAQDYTAEIATLPPSRRQAATIRAAALSSGARYLLSAEPTPPRNSATQEPPYPSHA